MSFFNSGGKLRSARLPTDLLTPAVFTLEILSFHNNWFATSTEPSRNSKLFLLNIFVFNFQLRKDIRQLPCWHYYRGITALTLTLTKVKNHGVFPLTCCTDILFEKVAPEIGG